MDIDYLEWAASGTGILAAIIVSLNLGNKVTGAGFIIFTLSSIFWIISAYVVDEVPLIFQNMVLFFINLFGIYRWLYVKPKKEKAV